MKKILLSALFLLTLLASAHAAQAADLFTKDLRKGMTDPQVKYLQMVLNASSTTQVSPSGAGSPGKESFYFGIKTLKALDIFQTDYNLGTWAGPYFTPYGYVEANTRVVLNTLATSSNPAFLNSLYLQNANYSSPVITGISPQTVKNGDTIYISGSNFGATSTVMATYDVYSNVPVINGQLEVKVDSSLQSLFDAKMKNMDSDQRNTTIQRIQPIPMFVTVENSKGVSNAYQIYLKIQ